ncbi:hypothetical protein KCP75_24460 [Salmonella enterica subsp. enterica]|nr:hypothetical protein KCP75_24460 [Salmonella enterica subsp. enterica]
MVDGRRRRTPSARCRSCRGDNNREEYAAATAGLVNEDEQESPMAAYLHPQLEGFTVELLLGRPRWKARQQRPDAVILDVGPPDISGL